MIPFKPSSEKTLAHELLTFVKLHSVLKTQQKRLKKLKELRPAYRSNVLKWEELQQALHLETEIAKTEQHIHKLHHKTEEYEQELIGYIPPYLYNRIIEINLYGNANEIRYQFLLRITSGKEVIVTVAKS
jgi:hypothetical protein